MKKREEDEKLLEERMDLNRRNVDVGYYGYVFGEEDELLLEYEKFKEKEVFEVLRKVGNKEVLLGWELLLGDIGDGRVWELLMLDEV